MSARNLITIVPGPPSADGLVRTRGTKVLAGEDTEIHGIRRIELIAEAHGVWQVNLEANSSELPLALFAQLNEERMLLGEYSYPLVLWQGRQYTAEDLASYAAAHASACMTQHRYKVETGPIALWKRIALAGWLIAAGGVLGMLIGVVARS